MLKLFIRVLGCLFVLNFFISVVYASNSLTISIAGPSSYTLPRGINKQANYHFVITNHYPFNLYLQKISIDRGSLNTAQVVATTCSFYADGGTTPLANGESCSLTLQASVPSSPATYANTFTIQDRLGISHTSPTFSLKSVAPDSPRTDLLYNVGQGYNGYRYCTINTSSGNPSACTAVYSPSLSDPYGMAFSPDEDFIYVTNDESENSITLCEINESGKFDNCAPTGPDFSDAEAIVLNSAGTRAYISDYSDDDLSVCSVNTQTHAISNCQTSGGTFTNTEALFFNNDESRLYISNLDADNDTVVSVCDVSASTGLLSNCRNTGAPLEGGTNDVDGVVFNQANTLAYLAYNNGKIKLCSINSGSGLLENCEDTADGYEFDSPQGIKIGKNGQYLYVTHSDNDDGVDRCTIGSGGALSNCQPSGSTGFSNATSLLLNSANSKAYVGDVDGDEVKVCDVDSSTGELSNCVNGLSSGLLAPFAIIFNASNTKAYISNNNEAPFDRALKSGRGFKRNQSSNASYELTACDVNSTTHALENCQFTGQDFAFDYPFDMLISPSGNYFYVTTDNKTVDRCAINAETGLFSDCQVAASGFTDPEGLEMNAAGTKLYVGDYADGYVYLCAVAPATGAVSDCQRTGGDYEFYRPSHLIFMPDQRHLLVEHDDSTYGYDVCDVNQTTFALSNCQPSSAKGFGDVTSLALNTSGTVAYIADKNVQKLRRCEANTTTGDLSDCSDLTTPGSTEVLRPTTGAYFMSIYN